MYVCVDHDFTFLMKENDAQRKQTNLFNLTFVVDVLKENSFFDNSTILKTDEYLKNKNISYILPGWRSFGIYKKNMIRK